MPRYYSLNEAENISGISLLFIERAIREGLVDYIRPGERILISSDEVELWTKKDDSLSRRLERNEKFPIRKSNYVTQNNYILPFHGIFISWGEHPIEHCLRYAFDFMIIDEADFIKVKSGMTEDELIKLKMRRGINGNPRDFFCYEKEIIAPADGEIISASDPEKFINENIDGQGEIIIDHGNEEYGRLCHILGRSVRVKKGDIVRQGQVLCLAGGKHGDGSTQVPHLHWDVWDHTHFLFAKGIPVRISKALIHNNEEIKKKYNFYIQDSMLLSNV